MEISMGQLNWADSIMLDVVSNSDNPNAEEARLILVMLATTAFDLQKRLSAHEYEQFTKKDNQE